MRFPRHVAQSLKTIANESSKSTFKKYEFWITVLLSVIALFQTWHISQQNQRIEGFEKLITSVDSTQRILSNAYSLSQEQLVLMQNQVNAINSIDSENRNANSPNIKINATGDYYGNRITIWGTCENVGVRNAENFILYVVISLGNRNQILDTFHVTENLVRESNIEFQKDVTIPDKFIDKKYVVKIIAEYLDSGTKNRMKQVCRSIRSDGSQIFFDNSHVVRQV